MTETPKVGLFGGAFDPPTIGHLETAKQVLTKTPDVSAVWLMPCNSHNFGKDMASPEHRFAMCKIASEEFPGLFAWDFEINKKTDGCTFNTVNTLLAANLNYQFVWIIGGDNALIFHKWYEHEKLRDLIEFAVVPRPGYEVKALPESMVSTVQTHRIVGHDTMEISSTKVRELLLAGEYNETSKWLSPRVFEYIMEHGLYGTEAGH